MTGSVIAFPLPGAQFDHVIDQIRAGIAVGKPLPAGTAGRRLSLPPRATHARRP